MAAAHIEAGTEVTVTVRPWVMQCCCGLGGPATVAVVAVDVVPWCSAADCRVETSAPTSTPLLCTEILTLSLTLQHAANITQHGRHHGHGATQTHNTCQQVNTQHNTWPSVNRQHVATCEHGGAATCRLLLGGVAPEVLRALVLAGAALPVGRAGGVRHGGAAGAARAARACWPGHWLSCSEQRWCQVRGGHWSLGDTVSSLRSVLAP